ncbi:MAG: DUF1592 domain-containing protein, partial [Acidobacteriota bacterium]|nr:DUF1592 domain-containing protein [Acidobacteriota bacterium]
MKQRRLRLGILLFAGLAAVSQISSSAQRAGGNTAATSIQRGMVQEYCIGCHSQKANVAGVSLEGLDFNNVGSEADIWEKVLRKVRTGQMPPARSPQPDAHAAASFVTWLEGSLDKAAAAHPNPGRPAVHRLNRVEYSNAVRDLLALDIKPGMALPVDDSGYGFDNIGDVLTLSPALLERYMSAARRVSRLAIGDRTIKPAEERFQPRRTNRNERASDDLPFLSRGGLSVQYYFPLDGEYLLRIKTPSNGDTGEPSRFYEMRLPVKAGLRNVGATFPRASAKAEPALPGARRGGGGATVMAPQMISLDLRLDGARIKRFEVPDTTAIEVLIFSGPYNVTNRGETASRERIFICRPASEKEENPCAKKILNTLARRAFRRPATEADIKPLLAFYEAGRQAGEFDDGIQQALEALLVSPDFLFRVERGPQAAAFNGVYRLNDFELASRLSFFLWSSIPDDELLNLAEQGKLKDSAMVERQIHRMLADPRSLALVGNFGGQWLHLRNLETHKPDPDMFSNFDESLRQSFRRETELFFESILREDRSLFELLDANYTFLNQRLAEHYGIAGIYGSQFRRVMLDDATRASRGGLLG